jgi:hypothetical protein
MGKKVKVTRIVDVTELGRKGGQATAAARTPKERQAAAQTAIKARWDAYYKLHPEKLKAKIARQAAKKKTAKGNSSS